MARWLPVHRRRRAVEFRPCRQQGRAAILHPADGAVAHLRHNFESAEKIDDHTVAITTKVVESLFPYSMSYLLMSVPAAPRH